MRTAAACFALIVCSVTAGWTAEPAEPDSAEIREVKSLFDKYKRMESDFDPSLVDLYSDEVVIRITRKYPDGAARVMTIPAKQYKPLIRTAMPAAKARGDTNVYKNSTYSRDGDGVRIKSSRYSNLKKYESPISILVRPNKLGEWRITEELSESRVLAD